MRRLVCKRFNASISFVMDKKLIFFLYDAFGYDGSYLMQVRFSDVNQYGSHIGDTNIGGKRSDRVDQKSDVICLTSVVHCFSPYPMPSPDTDTNSSLPWTTSAQQKETSFFSPSDRYHGLVDSPEKRFQ